MAIIRSTIQAYFNEVRYENAPTIVGQIKRHIIWREWDTEAHVYRCGVAYKNGRVPVTGEYKDGVWTAYNKTGTLRKNAFNSTFRAYNAEAEFRNPSLGGRYKVAKGVTIDMADYWTEADEAFFTYLKETCPSIKYWWEAACKLPGLNWGWIFCFLHYMAVPETESMIKLMARNLPHRCCAWISPKWLKISAARRRAAINHLQDKDTWACAYTFESYWMTKEEFDAENLDWRRLSPNRREFYKQYLKDKAWVTRHEGEWNSNIACEYRDYLVMRQDRGYDIFDDYWRRNKNWKTIHAEDIRAYTAERELMRNADEGETAMGIILKEKYLQYKDYVLEEGNLRAFMSDDADTWRAHASALKQCIVAARYYAKTESRLVFVERDGIPDSTFEIDIGTKRIKQSYGLEDRTLMRSQMKPQEDATKLAQKFRDTFLK